MGEQSEHALLSASGAPRWTRCYGSVALESLVPNRGSSYAREGTAMHGVGAYLLSGKPNRGVTQFLIDSLGPVPKAARDFVGSVIEVEGDFIFFDDDLAKAVQEYVDLCRSIAGDSPLVFVEERVNYASALGVDEALAWGTTDFGTILLAERELVGIDLKGGKGVLVTAENNEQQMLYAVGLYEKVKAFAEIDTVRMIICQPRIEGGVTEHAITVKELMTWARTHGAMAAQHAVKWYRDVADAGQDHGPIIERMVDVLVPGDKQCRFCNAKAICPKLTQDVVNTVADDFVDLDNPEKGTLPKTLAAKIDVKALSVAALAEKMRACDLIEAWVKDVRAAVETHLLQGEQVPGYKLVQGKKGARRWSDAEAAAKRLKTYLGAKDAMKPAEPISPTEAEKRLTAKQYGALLKLELITQADGGVSVAPETDKRPAYVPVSVDDFENLEGEAGDLSHLV